MKVTKSGAHGLARERADDVVGLVAVELQRGQIERADEPLHVGNGRLSSSGISSRCAL